METLIIEDFNAKCENLLQKYKSLQQFDYGTLVNLWNEINFDDIYKYISYDYDLSNVDEKRLLFVYLYKGMEQFARATDLYKQVGAFYILHRLYYKQTSEPKVKIRLTSKDHDLLTGLMTKMKELKQYQFLYVYAKLKTDEAFDYVVTHDEMTMNFDFNFNRDANENDEDRLEDVLETLLYDSDIMFTLTNTQDTYSRTLKEYLEENPQFTFTSNKTNIVTELQEVHNNDLT